MRGVVWSFWQQDLHIYSYLVFQKSPLKGAGRVGFFSEKDDSDGVLAMGLCVNSATVANYF